MPSPFRNFKPFTFTSTNLFHQLLPLELHQNFTVSLTIDVIFLFFALEAQNLSNQSCQTIRLVRIYLTYLKYYHSSGNRISFPHLVQRFSYVSRSSSQYPKYDRHCYRSCPCHLGFTHRKVTSLYLFYNYFHFLMGFPLWSELQEFKCSARLAAKSDYSIFEVCQLIVLR